MEKQGMAGGKRAGHFGLLIALIMAVLPAGILYSLEAGDNSGGGEFPSEIPDETFLPLEVRIESSPASPAANSPWSLFILIDHPVPSDVKVISPRFPASFLLERVRTETRLMLTETDNGNAPYTNEPRDDAPETKRWTRFEFLFMPQRAGIIKLEPFEINARGRTGSTGEITVTVREGMAPAVTRYTPRFRWLPVSSVPLGEKAEIVLELSGYDPSKKAPENLFRGKAPFNAIIEENAPRQNGEGSYIYTLEVIPLEGNSVKLNAFSLPAEGFTLNVPEINIPLAEARRREAAPVSPEAEQAGGENNSGDSPPRPDFPPEENKIFFLFAKSYSRIIAGVREKWEAGAYAEALAEIRRNERDSLPGPYLAKTRGQMEERLGLGVTGDENWHPLGFSVPAWLFFAAILSGAAALLIFFNPRKSPQKPADGSGFSVKNKAAQKNVTSRRRGGLRIEITLLLVFAAAVVLFEKGFGYFSDEYSVTNGKTAVLKQTRAYRVPDFSGTVSAVFDEGQPVTAGGIAEAWCYAESSDGRSGWVPCDAVIYY